MGEIKNRYDFVILFDIQDGNPNGDPDAGNLPRVDPETGHGLVSDVCLKRKVRNYVSLSKGGMERYDIYVKEKAVLAEQQGLAYKALGQDGNPLAVEGGVEGEPDADEPRSKQTKSGKQKKPHADKDVIEKARDWMCRHFFDIRAFGAVMSNKENNSGQVRGPVQLTFARSIDPVFTLEHCITRMAVTKTEDAIKQHGDNRTMGRKYTISYGLYKAHGFISPAFARQTHFDDEDLEIFWTSIVNMFEHDRSAARGLMSVRRLIVFQHETELGNAPAHRLFDRVKVSRRDSSTPGRSFDDYVISVEASPLGITCIEKVA